MLLTVQFRPVQPDCFDNAQYVVLLIDHVCVGAGAYSSFAVAVLHVPIIYLLVFTCGVPMSFTAACYCAA